MVYGKRSMLEKQTEEVSFTRKLLDGMTQSKGPDFSEKEGKTDAVPAFP